MNKIIQHIQDLRQAMANHNIHIYIQPGADPHLSEYVSDRFKGREYLTGFTGSAGTVVVTADQALLFTDGRYFIQAEQELKDTGVLLMKIGTDGYPSLEEWVRSKASTTTVIGLDGRLYSHNDLKALKQHLQGIEVSFITDVDLLEEIWSDRPGFPCSKVYDHPLMYAGTSAKDKISQIQDLLKDKGGDGYMISALNDIAWLLNIRADDVIYTPVVYAYVLMSRNTAQLFIHQSQLPEDLKARLENDGVVIQDYEAFYPTLMESNEQTMLYDPAKVNAQMTESIPEGTLAIECPDLVYMTKACITPAEHSNWANAQLKDGLAMIKFLHWFDRTVPSGKLTEYEAEQALENYRREQDLFIEPSFRTIPAYGGNGALMHYSTSKDKSPIIQPEGLFLLDSGGQYLDGTTDITRTMAVGPLTQEEIKDFTLVVKAHIRLNQAVFLQGVTGTNIDFLARQVMWENHMDYKSGTGHSIGYVLGVHEGPGRIKKELSDVVLKPGMVLTNEPGVYKEGQYGIRIENTLLVEERASNATGTYLGFELMSWCPIDTRGINVDMLETKELDWLNDYHQKVYEKLSPFVEGDLLEWLKEATQTL